MSFTKGKIATGMLASLLACHGSSEGKASLPAKGEEGANVANAAPQAAPAAPVATAVEPGTAVSPKAEAPASEPGTTVVAKAPAPANPAQDYRLTGQVTSIRHSQLTFRVSGFIKSVPVKPGNRASAGQVLATVDDRDFILRVDLAKARVDTAKVQLDEASKELKREEELKQANASTATSYDKIRSTYDQAKVGLKLAEIDLETATLALKDTKLIAPYDCVVSEQLKYDGESVQVTPPAPVIEVYDTAEPELTLSAPERLMGQVQVGSSLKIVVPSAGYSGAGTVTRIVPVINERSRTFQVIAKFNNYSNKVVPGTYAEATIE